MSQARLTWSSSTAAVATINAAGLAATHRSGQHDHQGRIGQRKRFDETHSNISYARLDRRESRGRVTSERALLSNTPRLANSATAASSDLTSSVTWSSSATTFVTINSAGLAQAVSVGSANIFAMSGSVTGRYGRERRARRFSCRWRSRRRIRRLPPARRSNSPPQEHSPIKARKI